MYSPDVGVTVVPSSEGGEEIPTPEGGEEVLISGVGKEVPTSGGKQEALWVAAINRTIIIFMQ